MTANPALAALRRAVTGRIESGDAVAIVEIPARPGCAHSLTTDVGTEPDGSVISRCDTCGERWNEGVA